MLRGRHVAVGIGSTFALAFACQGKVVSQDLFSDTAPNAGTGGSPGAGGSALGGVPNAAGGMMVAGAGGTSVGVSGSSGSAGSGGSGGSGTTGCAPDQTSCNGACVVTASDNANCGTCLNACPVGSSCTNSVCACPGGAPLCNNACPDTSSDLNNCGTCGNVCGPNTTCTSGGCQCLPNLTTCPDGCFDTESDSTHCGNCNTACPANEVCSEGQCGLDCADGLTQCGQDCVDLQSNNSHCNACDAACTGGRVCSGGACDCQGDLEFCNGQCIDTSENDSNCGACGTVCSGGRSCNGGVCECPSGQEFCNNQCRNVSTDPAYCGSCTEACPSGQTCSGGNCQCPGGQTMCGTACYNLTNDPQHCGTCTTVCASGSCSGSTCAPVSDPSTGLIGWATVNGTTTGGKGGTTVDVDTASELESAAENSSARIIRLTANISVSELHVTSNKTLVGVNNNIVFSGGISIDGESNVIIQNLKINGASSQAQGDGINIQESHHIWIDHCEIYDAPDGNLDITNGANYITVSWTKFRYSTNSGDHRYSNLIGSGDGVTSDENALNITWHHNWWANNVHERMPRVRFGDVHVFNNYYSSSGNNYCIRAGFHSKVLVENNFFQSVDTPHELGEDQGTAQLVANNNHYASTTGGRATRGSAFDPPYDYTMDAATSINTIVQNGAGPRPTPPE